jgi:serine/threonine protein kinase
MSAAAAATATRKRPAPDGTDTGGGGAGRKGKQARITLGSIGDYETQEAIGAGSFGVVVKARHRGTGEAVAIKCARKAPNSTSNLRRILREAGCMAACRGHPSVVGIRDVVVDAATGDAFLVMELVAGGSLLRLQRTRPAGAPVAIVTVIWLVTLIQGRAPQASSSSSAPASSHGSHRSRKWWHYLHAKLSTSLPLLQPARVFGWPVSLLNSEARGAGPSL